MDSPARTLAKTLTWQASGFLVMVGLTWIVTGSLSAGGMIALGGAAIGTVTYALHERLWARITWGRRSP